ncbi:MAG: hypothetical protein JO154_03400 [Chitinophaga sp.]|uniref:hypothetical protein n=1 Tax=Chitinophaga sp. TaxID=1869181 RepID=UPI0025BCA430|nr:hypothetical protein [Chitinophaga sp.]MBV8251629.1 hypothetical protein [Chitinophaga sp.]
MVKKILLFILLSCPILQAQAQVPNAASKAHLRHYQDTLQQLSQEIFSGKGDDGRQQACDAFIPTLVRALKSKYSFKYRFDSLRTVSIQYPTDSSFRIFTWALERENGFYRHYGAIQMNTPDGQLKLFPLFDASDYMTNPDTITDNKSWYGCLYYRIEQKHYFNKEYYTLFGWDANNPRSQKKIIEMLTFKNGQPVFGGPFFSFSQDSVKQPTRNRFILEYKKESSISLNYNKEKDMIIFDHLISESNEPEKKFTLVSDMDYEGFKWMMGQWIHVEKIFHDAIPLGQGPPVPQPMDVKKKSMTNPKSVDDYNQEAAPAKQPTGIKKPKQK